MELKTTTVCDVRRDALGTIFVDLELAQKVASKTKLAFKSGKNGPQPLATDTAKISKSAMD